MIYIILLVKLTNGLILSINSTQKTTDSLKKDVLMLEMSIVEKKKQLEKLVHEMKEVNLQSLTVTTEDHHLFYDGKFIIFLFF